MSRLAGGYTGQSSAARSRPISGWDLRQGQHYITDLTAAFSECARVLRREGVLVFSTHHPFDAEGLTPSRADVMVTYMPRSSRRNGRGSARCVIGAGRCAMLLNR